MQMYKVWIGVSRSKHQSLFDRAIRLFQKTNYEHAFGMIYSKDTRSLIIMHACGKSVQSWLVGEFLQLKEIVHLFEFEVTEEVWHKVIENHVRLDGTEYSTRQIVMMALNTITGGKLQNRVKSNGEQRFVCSEYSETFFESMGIQTVSQATGIPADFVTPKDTFTHLYDLSIRGICRKVEPGSVDNVLAYGHL